MSRFTRTAVVASAVSAIVMGGLVLAQGSPDTPPSQHGQKPIAGAPMAGDHTMGDQMAGDHMMATKDIIDTATGPGMSQVTTVVDLIKAAGLVDTLKGPGPFTVFAPTNAAFEKLGKAKCDELMKPENKETLKGILLYHVHAGDAIKAADVKTMSLSTANGAPLMVKKTDAGVMINDAKVIKTDVVCTNGVIHWVDTVLVPSAKMGETPKMEKPMGGGM